MPWGRRWDWWWRDRRPRWRGRPGPCRPGTRTPGGRTSPMWWRPLRWAAHYRQCSATPPEKTKKKRRNLIKKVFREIYAQFRERCLRGRKFNQGFSIKEKILLAWLLFLGGSLHNIAAVTNRPDFKNNSRRLMFYFQAIGCWPNSVFPIGVHATIIRTVPFSSWIRVGKKVYAHLGMWLCICSRKKYTSSGIAREKVGSDFQAGWQGCSGNVRKAVGKV